MMKEPPIRIEDVLNGKYRFVEGQPVRRSYVDMENIGIENMKYKVGDRVKIKSLNWYNEHKDETDDIECSNNIWFYREMSKFCGKVMTISHVRADHYTMVEDLVGYWTDEMIECKVEEECPQDFIEKYCRSCGTQRCDRTKEYLNGCPYYNAYMMCKKQNNAMEEETQSKEMLKDLKENAKHYWEVITGGSKPKFKVGDRVLLALHPCVVNKVEWRGDSKYVGYVYTVRGTDFGKKVKEVDLMLDPRKEETKSHNNMCKQLIDEMNPNVEINVKTKPKPSNTVSVDKATEVFADMLVELCPELLGFGGAAKEWENEFRKRLEE